MADQHVLFLQGLPSLFFSRTARALALRGCRVSRINLCLGDQLYWRGPHGVNYRGRASDWPDFIARFMDRHRVTDIVLAGEQRSYHKAAIEAAQVRGIRVTVTDFGYLRPDWMTFERDGMSANSRFTRDPAAIMRLGAAVPPADLAVRYADGFWSMAIGDMLYHFGNQLFFWLYPHYRRPYRRDPALLHYLSIGRRLLLAGAGRRHAERRMTQLAAANARYFVFPLQLENDFQILAYSPFASLEQAIEAVIGSFARCAAPRTRLLVKLHPLEPGIKNWKTMTYAWARAAGVDERIDFFDGGDLDEIIRRSDGMVTVNSTAGLRALQLGSPVKTLGAAIYDVPGLTFQAGLDDFWTAASRPDTALVSAFVNAIAASIHIRGVFYGEPGLSAAADEAARRLHEGTVGCPESTAAAGSLRAAAA